MPTAQIPAPLVASAAQPFPTIIRAASALPLDTTTPCAGWDLGALVRHLMYWSPVLAATARRTTPAPPAPIEQEIDLAGWPDALEFAVDDLVDAWSDPGVWAGTVTMTSPDPWPAPMIGGMAFGEIVVHGWDLARTAGVEPSWDESVLTAALGAVAAMAGQARDMGEFGEEVAVPAGAPVLDRLLGITGRDPLWAG